ncbi:MAG: glycosyltransferase family 2 protein, partial [Planctomycetota bacterium]
MIRFRKNFGQTAALSAGFAHARGEIIVAIDGDLQNDPADIPKMVAKLEEGFDVVSGWRKKRHDNAVTRLLPSKVANWLISRITGVKLHDYGCTLKAYRREVLAETKLYGEMHRFIPALASWSGAKIDEMVVNHRPRTA